MQFEADTIDDLLNETLSALLTSSTRTLPTAGAARELVASTLILTNPLARISHAESRGTIFSCLGETLWYLSGSEDLQQIEYYIPSYKRFCKLPEDAVIAPGAYGPRMMAPEYGSQLKFVTDILMRKNHTRQAVIQIFDSNDQYRHGQDVPCTCSLQFLLRDGRLDLIVYMRSNDAFRGLAHDVFAFTIIQEIVARTIAAEVGTYYHLVGSLHLYDRDAGAANAYVQEGWHSKLSMPSMPEGNPWADIHWLLGIERALRTKVAEPAKALQIAPYWGDMARVLRCKMMLDLCDYAGFAEQLEGLTCDVFITCLRDQLAKATRDKTVACTA